MSIKRLSLETAKDLIGKYQNELKTLDFQVSEINSTLKELKAHYGAKKKVADKAAAKAAAKAKKKAAAVAKKKAAVAKKKAAAAAKKKAAAEKKRAASAKKKAAAAAKKAAKKASKPARKATARKTTAKRGRKATAKRGRKASAKKVTAKKAKPAARKKAVRKAAPKKRVAKKTTAKRKSSGSRGRKMSYSDWDMLVMSSLKGAKNPVRTATLLTKGTAHAKKSKQKSDETFVRAKVSAALQKLVNKTKQVKKVPAKGRGFAYLLK